MGENVDSQPTCHACPTCGREVDAPHSIDRRGAPRPSPRAIRQILEWVDHAHAAQRSWARNMLVVVLVLMAVLFLAMGLGMVD